MLTKNEFDEQTWKTLRETPQMVGAAVMMAGASGLGTVKESFAIAQGLLQGQSSQLPLLRDLSNRDEVMAGQDAMKEWIRAVDAGKSRELIQGAALERVRKSVEAVKAKGSAEELKSFQDWVYGVAEGVAKAAREGGFLGFGGVEVSAEESAFLAQLKTALQA